MQVLYASSATQLHVRFTQNLAVNKYKQRLSFERRCKGTAFYWDMLGHLSQFLSQLYFIACFVLFEDCFDLRSNQQF